MEVAQIMTKSPVTVRRRTSLERALELLDEHDIRHLPVVDDSGLVGVVSDRDVFDATGWLSPRQRKVPASPDACVGDIMGGAPVQVVPDEDVGYALGLMVQRRLGCLPVVAEGVVVGIVSETDVLRAYANASRQGDFRVKDDPPVDAHMSTALATIDVEASSEEAAALMHDRAIRHLPVLEGDTVVGILSDRDFRRVRGKERFECTPVREFMTPKPLVARLGEPLSSVALVLTSSRINALPVMDGERLAGIATTVDMMVPCALALQRR